MKYLEWVRAARRAFLIDALVAAKGNQCVAADALGVHRNTLYRMMQEDGITPRMVRDLLPITNLTGTSNPSRSIKRMPPSTTERNCHVS
jgi:hypothetical protein